ncbi:MAG: type II secretion system GspH family protein [Acidobacteriia bacterium]|nr:type II secretion system GspH family protein [Terriglobia bacterium]
MKIQPTRRPTRFTRGDGNAEHSRILALRTDPGRSESGFALASLMIFATFLLIAIAVSLPDLKTQSKREKELEMQFRAVQYLRAIQAYNRKFPNQWPTSLDALMNTNNVRFLRKKWKDPLTKDGEWRFIHLGPNGAVLDSQLTVVAPNAPSATGTSVAAGTQSITNRPAGTGMFSPGQGTTSIGTGSSSLSATQLSNLPIVGVASQSTEQALMECGGYDHYNQMEYIVLPGGRMAGSGCYLGVSVALLLPPGQAAGQPPPGTTSAPGQTTPGAVTTPPRTGSPPTSQPPGMTPFGNPPSRKK